MRQFNENDYMKRLTLMVSDSQHYKDNIESLIYDMVQLIKEMIPPIVEEAIYSSLNNFDWNKIRF